MAASKPKIQFKPFTMVRRALWGSQRFCALPDDATRYLYLYYLTGPHQTASGCFLAKDGYVLADLAMPGADWTATLLTERKQHLIASDLIMADATTGETLVKRWWKDNGPNNRDWYQGAQKQCEAIQSLPLREAAVEALEEYWSAFQAKRELPDSLDHDYPISVGNRLAKSPLNPKRAAA